MSGIIFDITGDDINEVNSKSVYRDNKLDCDFHQANIIAQKFQYISTHPSNAALRNDDKIAYFISYEKSRMDFLADIATATPTMESSKMLYMELLAGIDRNRILLDRISGVKNFRFQIIMHDCRSCQGVSVDCKSKAGCNNGLSKDSDFAVAIPNDILGQHALYIILENVIRNTAKHANPTNQLTTFHIEFREPAGTDKYPGLKSYYEVSIYDDVDYNTSEKTKDDRLLQELSGMDIVPGIDDNNCFDKLERLVYQQNLYINEDLLDQNYRLRQSAWGMIEMEAAAAYLRKIPVEHIDNLEYELNISDLEGREYNIKDNNYETADILKAFVKQTKDGKRHLAYRFFMLKPKEILAVIDDDTLEKIQKALHYNGNLEQFAYSLINHGIWLKYKGEYDPTGIDKFEEGEIYQHEILLDTTKNGMGSIAPSPGILPDRIVKGIDLVDDMIAIKDNDTAKDFKEKVWAGYRNETLDINVYISNYYIDSVNSLSFGNNNSAPIKAKYDDHAASWGGEYGLCHLFPNSYQYIDVINGLSTLYDLLRKASFDNGKPKDGVLYTKILDSIYTQIIIFDERVQEATELKYMPMRKNSVEPQPIPYGDIYKTTGIYIPDSKSFDFSKPSYTKDSRNVLINMLQDLPQSCTPKYNRVRFFVIHLGVLEKILSAEKDSKNEVISAEEDIPKLITDFMQAIQNEEENSGVKPVIVSGRGMPPNLPEDVSFVNLSALLQYLIDHRNKVLLNELLYAARIFKS